MTRRLNLGRKFTLMLGLVLLGGIMLSSLALIQALQRRAEGEVTAKGLLLLQAMNSVRYYTTNHIAPLLAANPQAQSQFISESVPAFSAREVFERLRTDEAYKTYFYKEATLNPTNPRDLADTFEAALVTRFINESEMKELSGFRELFGQRVFYNARPIKITNAACLSCHSDPATAPATLISSYNATGGFGWKLNDIVGAQIIYVPAATVDGITAQSFGLVMGIFLIIFSLVIWLINSLLRQNVIRPIAQLAGLAGKIAQGEATRQDAHALGPLAARTDELGQLAAVFQRMAEEVYTREQTLKHQVEELKIEIDQSRRERQVAEVVETEYFQQLQQKAKAYREVRRSQAGEGSPPSSAPTG